jgi:hypothetical protein
MEKNFSKQLTKQIGEHLVVAELGRRGIIAAPFAGNVPNIDILAYANGSSIPLQVKAISKGSVSVNAEDFLTMSFVGGVQEIKGLKDIEKDLIYVLVWVGPQLGQDRFFIYTQGDLQKIIHSNHEAVLRRFSGRRPKNPASMHCAYGLEQLKDAEDQWLRIQERLGFQQPLGNSAQCP